MNAEKLMVAEPTYSVESAQDSEEVFGPKLDSLYRPWSATPSGSPYSNPLVKRRLDRISAEEVDMVQYGYKDPEFKMVAPLVEVAYTMRMYSRATKNGESSQTGLYPEAKVSKDILNKDEIGLALPHELLYIMSKKGMKSKELGKITHLYGGENMKYAHEMHQEILDLLNDLELLSGVLSDAGKKNLAVDDFKYAKTYEDLQLMEELLVTPEGVQDVKTMDSSDHTYFRVAARDWTAPSEGQKIIMLKRKSRLGAIGDSEIILRTSFMVNLDEISSNINSKVLSRIKRMEYDKDWKEKIIDEKTGLIPEIERIGLEEDPYSLVLVSSTVYAKNCTVEGAIDRLNEEKMNKSKVWNPTLGIFT